MKIAFIGAGRMGLPMVRRLMLQGNSVVVYAHTDADASAADAVGASHTSELSEVAKDADAVVICVLHDRDVRSVTAPESGLIASMKPRSVLIIHTTGSPRTAEDLRGPTESAGLFVVDAAISGGPSDIDQGELTLFLGGNTQAKAAATGVLSAYGDPIIDVGALGNGQRTKLVNNCLFAATIGLAADATRIGRALGLDEAALAISLMHGSSSSRAVQLLAEMGSAQALLASTAEFLAKDLATMRETADQLDVDLGLLGDVTSSPTLAFFDSV